MKIIINLFRNFFNKKLTKKYKLSKELIKIYEDFIKNNISKLLPSISKKKYGLIKKIYNIINNSCINSFLEIGYNKKYTYSFYKATNNNIYIIKHYYEKIFYYSLVNEDWYILNYNIIKDNDIKYDNIIDDNDFIDETDFIEEPDFIEKRDFTEKRDFIEDDIFSNISTISDISSNSNITNISYNSLLDNKKFINNNINEVYCLLNEYKLNLIYINLFEKCIQNKIFIGTLPCISPKDYNNAKKCFNIIQKLDVNSFINFGCNGYTTYSYYKSSNGKIYVFSLFISDLYSIALLNNSWKFIL